MTVERNRLPDRRASESFVFELDGLKFTATISRFPDGRIGELFLNNHKAGNQSGTNAGDAAIILLSGNIVHRLLRTLHAELEGGQ
jgi:hypothetical protein